MPKISQVNQWIIIHISNKPDMHYYNILSLGYHVTISRLYVTLVPLDGSIFQMQHNYLHSILIWSVIHFKIILHLSSPMVEVVTTESWKIQPYYLLPRRLSFL